MKLKFVLKAILFIFALMMPALHLTGSVAQDIKAVCVSEAGATAGKAISSPTSTLIPTSDSQIFKDACGQLLAIMKSQTYTPTVSSQTISAEYGLPIAANPVNSVPILHSNPQATRKIYLDFDGYTFPTNSADTLWTGYFGGLAQLGSSIPGLDLDGNPNSFSQLEQEYITETWLGVAEDYSTFNIDVTTENPGAAGLTRSNANDVNFGQTAVISSAANWSAKCGCGGVSYVASINVIPSAYSINATLNPMGVNFNFNKFNNDLNYYTSAKDLAGIISHETGHAVGLGHDGTASQGYYPGHQNGIWAPIMGTSYNQAINHWSKNEYSGGILTSAQGWVVDSGWGWCYSYNGCADNGLDDFYIITRNNIPLKNDDYGNNTTDSFLLNRPSMSISGIVGPNQDIDFFKFTLTSNQLVSASAIPIIKSPNLDILMKIYDSNGQMLESYNPPVARGANAYPTGMDASFSRRAFAPGTYYLSVQGTGWGNPLNTGYSNFASAGQYTLDFTVHLAVQTTLRIANSQRQFEVGQEVTLSTSGGTGTGAVTFSTTGNSCELDGNLLKSNSATTCSVVATKESDGVYAETSSSSVNFTFLDTQQTLTITNNQLNNPVGTTVTITTSGGSGNGLVSFSLSSPNSLCRVRSTSVTASQPTACSIIATKAAQGLFASKSSAAVVFTFKGTQAALVINNSNTSVPINTEVVLATSGGSGSGAITYLATGENCQITENRLTSNSATTCSVVATKDGDNLYAAISSAAKVFNFLQGQADFSISNLETSNPVGTQVSLTTSGGSGLGAVTYRISVSNPLCSLVSDKLVATEPTQCVVIATKAAQGLFADKESGPVTFSFKGAQSTLRITNLTRINNIGVEVALTTTGGSGTGAVTFNVSGSNCSINGNKLTANSGTICQVTSTKAGDNTFAPINSAQATFTFLGEQAALSITNQVTSGTVGSAITLTSAGGSGTGAVSYVLSVANSTCRISRNLLTASAGTNCVVIARKAAQGLFQSAISNSVTFNFKGPQATLFVSNQTISNPVGTEVVLTTSGGSGTGAVSFQVTGNNCSLNNNKLTANSAASCSVVASKAEDNNFSATVSNAKIFLFLGEQVNLSISNQVTTNTVGTIIALTTQGGSGAGAVTFNLSTPNPLCSLTGSNLTSSQPTECIVRATKAAEGLYNSTTSNAVSFYFKGSQSSLRIANAIRTVSVGIQLQLSTTGGSGTGNVTYSVTGTNCQLNNNVLSATSGTTCNVVATKAADALYNSKDSSAERFVFLEDQAALSITNNVTTNSVGTSVILTSNGGSGSGAITYQLATRNTLCRIVRGSLTASSATTCRVVVSKAASGFYSQKISNPVDFIFN